MLSLTEWSMWLIPLMKSVCLSQRMLLVRKLLCGQSSQTEGQLTTESSPADKMISSEALEGVPLLVLANKQDIPVH